MTSMESAEDHPGIKRSYHQTLLAQFAKYMPSLPCCTSACLGVETPRDVSMTHRHLAICYV